MKLLISPLGHIYSNIPLNASDKLADAKGGESREHTFLDFGDDEFTVGRPHPMIDPSLRAERVVKDGRDPGCAVILCDCVIGCGSHSNPAEDLAAAIQTAKAEAAAAGEIPLLCLLRLRDTGRPAEPEQDARRAGSGRGGRAAEQRAGGQSSRCSFCRTARKGEGKEMSKLNELFQKKLHVVNFGIEAFYDDLAAQGVPAVHVDWKPVAGGDKAACGEPPQAPKAGAGGED